MASRLSQVAELPVRHHVQQQVSDAALDVALRVRGRAMTLQQGQRPSGVAFRDPQPYLYLEGGVASPPADFVLGRQSLLAPEVGRVHECPGAGAPSRAQVQFDSQQSQKILLRMQ